MLTYRTSRHLANRTNSAVEICDSYRLSWKMLYNLDSVTPDEGCSLFAYQAILVAYKIPHVQLQLLADYAYEECEFLEQVLQREDQILDRVQIVVDALLQTDAGIAQVYTTADGSAVAPDAQIQGVRAGDLEQSEALQQSESLEEPEVLFQAYVAVCGLLPDLQRDCGSTKVLERILSVLRLDRVQANLEALHAALCAIAQAELYCGEGGSESSAEAGNAFNTVIQRLVDELAALCCGSTTEARFMVLELLALLAQRRPQISFRALRRLPGAAARLALLAIRRPRGSLHSRWRELLDRLLGDVAAGDTKASKELGEPYTPSLLSTAEAEAAYLLYFAATANISGDAAAGTDAQPSTASTQAQANDGYAALLAFVYQRFGTVYRVRNAIAVAFLQYKLPSADIAASGVFRDDREMRFFAFCGQLKAKATVFPQEVLQFALASFKRFLCCMDVLYQSLQNLLPAAKAQLFSQVQAEVLSFPSDERMLCLAAAMFYFDQTPSQEALQMCLAAADAAEMPAVALMLQARGALHQVRGEAEIQTAGLHIYAESDVLVELADLLSTTDPAEFCLRAEAFRHHCIYQADAQRAAEFITGRGTRAVAPLLASRSARVRKHMLGVVCTVFNSSILKMVQNLFCSKDMDLIQQVLVYIGIYIKANALTAGEFELICAAAFGMLFQRNGRVQEKFFDLLAALAAFNRTRLEEVFIWTGMQLYGYLDEYEDIDLNDLVLGVESNRIEPFRPEIDARVIARVASDVRALVCCDIDQITAYYERVSRWEAAELDDLLFFKHLRILYRFGERFGSVAEANSSISLSIQQVRTTLVRGMFQEGWKLVMRTDTALLCASLEGFYYSLLQGGEIDLYFVRFILYGVIANIEDFGSRQIGDVLIKLAQFACFEPVLPELCYLCCVNCGITVPWLVARMVNLYTVNSQLSQVFPAAKEPTYQQTLRNSRGNFERFYQLCTTSDYQNAQEYGAFSVDLDFNNAESETVRLFLSLLVSRATRSTRSQSLTGVGYANVGKAGNEKARKRKIILFVKQSMKALQAKFYNGQLLSVFRGLFATDNILGFLEESADAALFDAFAKLNLRKLHSYLQTFSALSSEDDVEFPFIQIAKLMYALAQWMYSPRDGEDEGYYSMIKYCQSLAARVLGHTLHGLLFSGVFSDAVPHRSLLHGIFAFCCKHFSALEVTQYVVLKVLEDYALTDFLEVDSYVLFPLLHRLDAAVSSVHSVAKLACTFKLPLDIVDYLRSSVHEFIKKPAALHNVTDLLPVFAVLSADDEIVTFCLNPAARDATREYLLSLDFAAFEQPFLRCFMWDSYFQALFPACKVQSAVIRDCTAALLGQLTENELSSALATNSAVFERVFFCCLLSGLCNRKMVNWMDGYLVDRFLDFLSKQLVANSNFKIADYAGVYQQLAKASFAKSRVFGAFRVVVLGQSQEIADFIDYLTRERSEVLYNAAESRFAAFHAVPFLLICLVRIKNYKLRAKIAGFIADHAKHGGSEHFVQLVSVFRYILPVRAEKLVEDVFLECVEAFEFRPNYNVPYGFLTELLAFLLPYCDYLRSGAQFGAVIYQNHVDQRAFSVYIRVLAAQTAGRVTNAVTMLTHRIFGLALAKAEELRKTAAALLCIISRSFGLAVLQQILASLITQVGSPHQVFYLTNLAFDLLREHLCYSCRINCRDAELVLRGRLSRELGRTCVKVINLNLFSNAQYLKHSEAFARIVRRDEVYKLISLLIAGTTYDGIGGILISEIVIPLLLKAKDFKTDYSDLIFAICAGFRQNTSFHLREAVELAMHLLNDEQCPYCKSSPQKQRMLTTRRQQILADESLTPQYRQALLRNVHYLLEKPPEPPNYDSYIRAVQNINYDPNLCIHISLVLVSNAYTDYNYALIDDETNARLEQCKAYGAALPAISQYSGFAGDALQHQKQLELIFDYAVYSSDEVVLHTLYECLERFVELYGQVSAKFTAQSINQLDFIASEPLKCRIFNFLINALRKDALKPYLQKKLLFAAIVHSKQQDSWLAQPFQVILEFQNALYATFQAEIDVVVDFHVRNSIFKLAGARNSAMCAVMAQVFARYFELTESTPSPLDLLKIAVESELFESRIMALQTLYLIAVKAQLPFIGEKGLLGLVPARAAASGVVAEDLRKEIAKTLLVFSIQTDFSQFAQFFGIGSVFFVPTANLLAEAMELQTCEVFGQKVDVKDLQRKIAQFVEKRAQALAAILANPAVSKKAAQSCLKLCALSSVFPPVPPALLANEELAEDVIRFYLAQGSVDLKLFAYVGQKLRGKYVRALGHKVAAAEQAAEALADDAPALLELMRCWIQFDEERVLLHGKTVLAMAAARLEPEARAEWLEQLRAAIGIDEIFEYLTY